MTDKPEKVNMFEKASEDRRKRFIEENDFVADEIVSTTKTNLKLESFLTKPKIIKKSYNYYIETRIDDLFTQLGEIMESSKSDVFNQILVKWIQDGSILKEMAEADERIKKLLDEFNK